MTTSPTARRSMGVLQTKKLYIMTALYASLLLLAALVDRALYSNWYVTVIAVVFAVVGVRVIKTRPALELHRNEVAVVTVSAAILAATAVSVSGVVFGFYANKLSFKTVYTYIIPILLTIVAGEIFRSVLLSQKKRSITAISYVCFVILDVCLFANKNAMRSVSSFMTLLGMVILPALASNLLFHFLSSKYGVVSVIPYRLILSIYTYLLPFKVATPAAMLAFLKLVYPLILCWFVQKLFQKRTVTSVKKSVILSTVSSILCLTIMLLGISFVSGVFKYKAVVVASGSMAGEIDRGDIVVYEDYDNQTIEIGQVVLFNRNETLVIHRVVDIKKINGVYQYYTKGDANDSVDTGYVTKADLVGVTTMKIKYLGYPTTWMYDAFKK